MSIDLSDRLRAWYDRHRRRLPWRAEPGQRPDPYHVWLSEIMLQQTTVATVGPYFRDFLARWPDVMALAAAPLDDVLHAWQGLGYYARARNLHACAKAVAGRHAGRFPDSEEALLALPGVGAYTAAAVAAIAFDRVATVVDGNVERVIARLRAIETPLPGAKPAIRAAAAELTPIHRPGDHAQAMMDLGATICTSRAPKCLACPFEADCEGRRRGLAEALPAKRPKPARPVRHGVAFWAVAPDGRVLFRRRPEKGLLGGLMEVPWSEDGSPPFAASWRPLPGVVRHVFTHFELVLEVRVAAVPAAVGDGVWRRIDALGDLALPTLMKKVVAHALASVGG